MFETSDLDSAATLEGALQRRRAADRAEAELLALAAHWADLHPVITGEAEGFRVEGMERLVPLAGPGAPEVAEFAPAELAATLGLSTYAGQRLVGDALELRHRLPRLWARIQGGSLQAWRGRQIADRSRCLSLEAATWLDAQLAPFAHKIGLPRVIRAIEAAMVRFDPEEAARREQRAADGRGVFVGEEMTDGTRSIRIEADALDVTAFDETIDAIADGLASLGDDDLKDVRRAKAVGVIADPQGTLDLLASDADEVIRSAAGTNDSGSGRGRSRGRRGSGVTLYVHLHADAMRNGSGVARVEGLGPITLDLVKKWLGRTDVKVQPVIDLADRTSVDAYEAPGRVREAVVLRNPCCPFPWCDNTSRRKDLDHIEEYVPPSRGGPPGQTNAANLAPLCRRHHRLKTHGGWTYSMPEPGLYRWRSPRGRTYVVDHTGSAAHSQ